MKRLVQFDVKHQTGVLLQHTTGVPGGEETPSVLTTPHEFQLPLARVDAGGQLVAPGLLGDATSGEQGLPRVREYVTLILLSSSLRTLTRPLSVTNHGSKTHTHATLHTSARTGLGTWDWEEHQGQGSSSSRRRTAAEEGAQLVTNTTAKIHSFITAISNRPIYARVMDSWPLRQ